MNARVLALTVVASLAVACLASPTAMPFAELPRPRLGVKSGAITLAYSEARETTDKVYFDDWGEKQVRFSRRELDDYDRGLHFTTVSLLVDTTFVQYDPDVRRGVRRAPRELDVPVVTTWTDAQLAEMNLDARSSIEVLPPLRILGVVANGYATTRERTRQFQWGYAGVFLKSDVVVVGEGTRWVASTAIATSAAFEVPIDPAKFIVPADVIVVDE